MRVLDVFSCIGFHSIGLHRSGEFETVALCESSERRERIEALGDSNPPAMAEVIGLMLAKASTVSLAA